MAFTILTGAWAFEEALSRWEAAEQSLLAAELVFRDAVPLYLVRGGSDPSGVMAANVCPIAARSSRRAQRNARRAGGMPSGDPQQWMKASCRRTGGRCHAMPLRTCSRFTSCPFTMTLRTRLPYRSVLPVSTLTCRMYAMPLRLCLDRLPKSWRFSGASIPASRSCAAGAGHQVTVVVSPSAMPTTNPARPRAEKVRTMYQWLHGGYIATQRKKPATVLIAGFPYVSWGG